MKFSQLIVFICLIILVSCTIKQPVPSRPNIVWIMLEDWGYQLSCYGEKGIQTPNIDRFASEGVRFTNSFCTSPVCSPSRSAMITGFYQNYIGAEQHRTEGPGFPKKELPYGIRPITHLLEDVGYFTCFMGTRKTDLNFLTDRSIYKGNDWCERKAGQPFYAQITYMGSHRPWQRDSINPINQDSVNLPPYYPQTDFARRDYANGLEAMQNTDRQVGDLLTRLDKEGLAGNTLVFIIGDNGLCMPRGKEFLYDEGIRVPVLVRWPGQIDAGQVACYLVNTLDITKTILDIAGVNPGYTLHGLNLFGKPIKNRKFIYVARDKMGGTHDAMRAIRTRDFKLIHNLMPERAYCQYNPYKENSYPILAQLNVMNLKGELDVEQAMFMASHKPEYELYNLMKDPWELHNLADDPKYKGIRENLKNELENWCKNVIRDKGVTKEFRMGGYSSDYPTKTLKEWEEKLEIWETWVYRQPEEFVKHPFRPYKK